MSWADYPLICKLFSTAIRRTSRWPDGTRASYKQVAKIAYWELSIGRSSNLTDWHQEEVNRVHSNIYLSHPLHVGVKTIESNEAYLAELRPIIDVIMRELVPRSPRPESINDFVHSRLSWVSSGSSGGYHIAIDGQNVRVNKHTMFEHVPTSEVLSWFEGEPKILGTGSEKMEAGKSRAIYGTKPADYTVMSYVIAAPERNLHLVEGVEAGLRGLDEIAGVYRRLAVVESESTECTMIDYTDFNLQHTLQAQSLLFRCLASRYEALGCHADLVRSAQWCEAAHLNQWVLFPTRKESQKVSQGMFSGQRGTNFINTAQLRILSVGLRACRS